MLKCVLFLLPAAGLVCLALSVLGAGQAEAPEKGLEFVRLELPDGTSWTLGEGGIGRPFLARMVLSNIGPRPIKIWDPSGSEGSSCPRVVLTDARGRETVLRPTPVPRFAGVPLARALAPSEGVAIELELLRLVDVHSPPPPGEYRIRAIYSGAPEEDPSIKGIWPGTVASEPLTMKIVAPPAPKPGG
jgi:hypothetical protein